MDYHMIIPLAGMLTGIIIPIAVFIWIYYENKDKRKTVLEIAKYLDDPAKLDELIRIFDDRKKEPIDYRRNGVITLFVGMGLYLLGYVWLGSMFEGIGLLISLIGVGVLLAGYLYPNTGKELTDAVEKYERK